MISGGFQNFLHAITGLPGGFGTGIAPQPDTHDGAAKKADYFVWREKDYRKHVLNIKDPEPEAAAPEELAVRETESNPEVVSWSYPETPILGPSPAELSASLTKLSALAQAVEDANARAAYLSRVAVLLELFAIREQAMQAQELALLMMLEN